MSIAIRVSQWFRFEFETGFGVYLKLGNADWWWAIGSK